MTKWRCKIYFHLRYFIPVRILHFVCENMYLDHVNLDPVLQSIVSLTISLRHKFVKQISAKVTYTLLFFVEKNVRILCIFC